MKKHSEEDADVALENIKIGKKLAVGFGAVTLIALFLGGIGRVGISRLSNDLAYLGENRIPDLQSFSEMNYLRMIIRSESQEVLSAEDSSTSDTELRRIIDRRAKVWERMDASWKIIGETERYTKKGEQLLEILKSQYEPWRRLHGELDRVLEEIVRAGTDDRKKLLFQDYKALLARLIPMSNAVGQTFDNITENNSATTAELIHDDIERAKFLERLSLFAVLAGVLAALTLTVVISRSISVPLEQGVELLTKLRGGDLSVDIPERMRSRKDEIGTLAAALHDLAGDLRAQIADIKDVTVALASSALQISSSISEVAAGAEETSVAVVETTATMEEVRTTAEVTNRKSREVADIAQQGLQLVQKGRVATDALFDAMKNIGEQMDSIAETIVRLSEQNQEVGEITGTVEDLAEQSNLLAVNAAVEAAKAGEQGRGFSVVAQEIKSLSEQSKQSAKEVQRILRDIQKATGAAVMAIEQGSKAVDQGTKDAGPSKESVQSIGKRFTETAQSAAQIAAANNELLAGMGQVAQAMESIKDAGEQNMAGMKDLESAAGNLKNMGQKLALLVERYKV